MAGGTELSPVGPDFCLWGRTLAGGTELGPELVPRMSTTDSKGVGPSRDRTGTELFSVPPMRSDVALGATAHKQNSVPPTGAPSQGRDPNKARSHIGGGRCSRGCLHYRRLRQHHFEAYVLARHTCCEPCLLARYNSRRGKLPCATTSFMPPESAIARRCADHPTPGIVRPPSCGAPQAMSRALRLFF